MGENEEILIQIKISEEEVEKKIISLTEAKARLRKELKALEKEYNDGTIDAKEYAQSQAAITKQLDSTNAELKSNRKTLADYEKSIKSAKGSLEQMSAQAALITPRLRAMSKEERETSEQGKLLVQTLGELNKGLKTSEAEYNVFGRNVGNYNDSIAEQKKLLSSLQDTYDNLTKAERDNKEIGGVLLTQIGKLEKAEEDHKKAVDNSRKGVKEYLRDVNVLGVNVGSTIDSFKAGVSGVGTFAKAIFSARGALIALTAIPIVLAFSAVVAVLTKTQKGLDFIARIGGSVSAVFNVLIKDGIELGKAFVEVFTKPADAIERFWRIIKGLPADLKDAAVAGSDVVAMSQQIREEERKTRIERAQNRAEIERLKKISEDTTKSQFEREAAAQAAYSIENKLLQQQIATQQKRIKNIKDEIALGQNTAEDKDKLADAEEKLADIQEESLGKQTELQNQLNQIRLEGQRQTAQLAVAAAERALTVAKESGKQTNLELYDLERDYLDKKLALDLVGVVKGSEAEKAIRLKYQSDLTALNLAATTAEEQRLSAIRTAELKKRLTLAKAGSEEEFNIRRGLIQQEYLDQVSAANATIKNKEELNQKLLELDAKYNADKELLDQEQRQKELSNQQALIEAKLSAVRTGSDKEYRLLKEQRAIALKKELDDVTKTEEEKEAIRAKYRKADEDAEKDHVQSTINQVIEGLTQGTNTLTKFVDASVTRQLNSLEQQQEAVLSSAALSADARAKIEAEFQKKKDKIEKEAAEKRRKIASVENIINTAASITKAFATAGPIVGAILAALAVAQGVAQQVIIDNQKFAVGGVYRSDGKGAYVRGPGTGTSDSINSRISNGESIINAKSTAMFYPVLSAINVAGGGRAFPKIGSSALYDTKHLTPQFQYGGVMSAAIDTDAIARAIRQGMQGVNVRVGVDRITKAQNEVKQAEVGADY